MKKILLYVGGLIWTFSLIFVLLITSVETVVYRTPGYFEKEYTKYGVTQNVDMTLDDLMDVTHEMMAYLRGNRADLHVTTTMGGVSREFFNEREISHMEDVRVLFIKSIFLRRLCLIFMASYLILLFFIKKVRTLPPLICAGCGIFTIFSGILGGMISTDFTKYFTLFHKIFFDNDLWLLDPNTDMLINIVPEPFFMDTAFRIGLTFGILMAVTFCAALLFTIILHRKKKLMVTKNS